MGAYFLICYDKQGDAAMYDRLRDLREDNGKKQSEIAAMLNCTQQAYSTYERGERDIPSKDLLTKVK